MAVEVFTAPNYTELDPGGDIAIDVSKIDITTFEMSLDARVIKDFGADYFDALDILVEMYIASSSSDYALLSLGLANVIDAMYEWSPDGISLQVHKRPGAVYRFNFSRTWDQQNDFWADGLGDTLYYCTITRAAGNDVAVCKIYDDAERTSLKATLGVAVFGTTKWQYSYGFSHYVGTGGRFLTGYIQNLDFQEAEAPTVTTQAVTDIGFD